MKIKYLGTAAYDAIPSPFCCCEVCEKARILRGKDLRTRTQALINDDLLIDFNPDTVSHFLRYGIDDRKIKTCVITHSHSDHLYPDDIVIPQYSSNPLTVNYFMAEDGYNRTQYAIDICDNVPKVNSCVKLTKVIPFEKFSSGGYTFLPLKANHDVNSSPVFYAIEKDGKRLLYAHDTGIFPEESFDHLEGFGVFDLISLDCTGSLSPRRHINGHMDLISNVQVIERLEKMGLKDGHTKVVLSHFSHNGKAVHSDIEKAAAPYGFTVAYDGLEIEF